LLCDVVSLLLVLLVLVLLLLLAARTGVLKGPPLRLVACGKTAVDKLNEGITHFV
jgi:hypothetical protein